MISKIGIFSKAKEYHRKGKLDEAIKIYENLVAKNKKDHQIYFFLGTAHLQKKNYKKTVFYIESAIKIKPNIPNYYNNIGIALSNLNSSQKAIENYLKALELNNKFLDANINLAIEYKKILKFEDAIKYFNASLKISPNNYMIHNNIGNLFKTLGKIDDAINSYNKSIELNKNNPEAYNNKAEILFLLKKFDEAINMYQEVLKINPDFPYAYGKLLHAKMHLCKWDNFKEENNKIISGIKENKEIVEPFPLLSIVDSLNLQFRNSVLYSKTKFNYNKITGKKIKIEKKNKKVKVGYFAAEFHNHPVMQLTKDIFKYHDKSKFEIIGFYHGTIKDELHYEVKKNFDKFYEISKLSDEEIVNLCKKINIDIAINLTGYTANSRNELFLKRVAPIQISYIGYLGTMGAGFMDYIISDRVLIDKKNYKFYQEEVINMPGNFFPIPSFLKISNNNFKRSDFKIPNDSFIFGNFNNSYKITPDIFYAWIEILKKTENSILWLLNKNDVASNNLLKKANEFNLDPSRIIFAEKMNYSEHLERFGLMNLFLDTFPYTAHTTAMEALKRSVPTLTIMGETFASRVAGSLLHALDLEYLVCKNIKNYIEKACEICSDRFIFSEIKSKLEKNIVNISNSKKYTKNLENIYENLVVKHS